MTLPLIVTRPDPGGKATVGRALAMGLDARHMPLFAARPLDWAAPDAHDFDALLLTSAQAVRLAGGGLGKLAGLPVYAVGRATADAAGAAGLRVAMTGDRDAQSLLDAMTSQKMERILWLCGRDRTAFDAGASVLTAMPCYAVDPVEPPAGWADAISSPAVLLAHSARAALRLRELAGEARMNLSLVAISPAVAVAAGGGWRTIAAADRPDDAAMLAEAHALCHKGG